MSLVATDPLPVVDNGRSAAPTPADVAAHVRNEMALAVTDGDWQDVLQCCADARDAGLLGPQEYDALLADVAAARQAAVPVAVAPIEQLRSTDPAWDAPTYYRRLVRCGKLGRLGDAAATLIDVLMHVETDPASPAYGLADVMLRESAQRSGCSQAEVWDHLVLLQQQNFLLAPPGGG